MWWLTVNFLMLHLHRTCCRSDFCLSLYPFLGVRHLSWNQLMWGSTYNLECKITMTPWHALDWATFYQIQILQKVPYSLSFLSMYWHLHSPNLGQHSPIHIRDYLCVIYSVLICMTNSVPLNPMNLRLYEFILNIGEWFHWVNGGVIFWRTWAHLIVDFLSSLQHWLSFTANEPCGKQLPNCTTTFFSCLIHFKMFAISLQYLSWEQPVMKSFAFLDCP